MTCLPEQETCATSVRSTRGVACSGVGEGPDGPEGPELTKGAEGGAGGRGQGAVGLLLPLRPAVALIVTEAGRRGDGVLGVADVAAWCRYLEAAGVTVVGFAPTGGGDPHVTSGAVPSGELTRCPAVHIVLQRFMARGWIRRIAYPLSLTTFGETAMAEYLDGLAAEAHLAGPLARARQVLQSGVVSRG